MLVAEREKLREGRLCALGEAYDEMVALQDHTDISVPLWVINVLKTRTQNNKQRQQREEKLFAQRLLLEHSMQEKAQTRLFDAMKKRHQGELARQGLNLGAVPGQGGASSSLGKLLAKETKRQRLKSRLSKLRQETHQWQDERQHLLHDIPTREQAVYAQLALTRAKDVDLVAANMIRREELESRVSDDKLMGVEASRGVVNSALFQHLYPDRYTDVHSAFSESNSNSNSNSSSGGANRVVAEKHDITDRIGSNDRHMSVSHQHPTLYPTSLAMAPSPQVMRWSDSTSIFTHPHSRPVPFGSEANTPKQSRGDSSAGQRKRGSESSKTANRANMFDTRVQMNYDHAHITSMKPMLDSALSRESPQHIHNIFKR